MRAGREGVVGIVTKLLVKCGMEREGRIGDVRGARLIGEAELEALSRVPRESRETAVSIAIALLVSNYKIYNRASEIYITSGREGREEGTEQKGKY